MSSTTTTTSKTHYEAYYDPEKVYKSPEFHVLKEGEQPDKKANIACAYNPKHEVHLIQKPTPKPGPGECIVHVKATGICG